MDTPPTAIIDACVLYSAPVRDLIVRLAQAGLIQARWTGEIHDEWMRNVLKNNPRLTRERLERTRSLMDGAVRDCLVTGYADLIDSLTLPDPDDRHVLAAAIRAGADVIVTYNLGDFPADALTAYGIEARHPDEFIAHCSTSPPRWSLGRQAPAGGFEEPTQDRGRIPRDPGAAGACPDGRRYSAVFGGTSSVPSSNHVEEPSIRERVSKNGCSSLHIYGSSHRGSVSDTGTAADFLSHAGE